MKKITLEKLKTTSVVITKEEQLWIEKFLLKMNVDVAEKTLVFKIFQMAKAYPNEKSSTAVLFQKGFKIYKKQLLTKTSFKNSEKWEAQLLWRVRMELLELQ
ncbi:hypothetical protein [Aequorivita marina]|uniref:hypothetical protein n=1 Tax=Aequorivita marina TaxID=3073654 RepID=UPI0028758E1B|nr:hypothetical protein [Aequorivita sp. S2608]MDS1297326.1 hypothetical protein [Aequorivita sp. S2608]